MKVAVHHQPASGSPSRQPHPWSSASATRARNSWSTTGQRRLEAGTQRVQNLNREARDSQSAHIQYPYAKLGDRRRDWSSRTTCASKASRALAARGGSLPCAAANSGARTSEQITKGAQLAEPTRRTSRSTGCERLPPTDQTPRHRGRVGNGRQTRQNDGVAPPARTAGAGCGFSTSALEAPKRHHFLKAELLAEGGRGHPVPR
jgi:hypothetical protein